MNTPKILIIDDDKDIRLCLRDVFKSFEYQSLLAHDAAEGIRILSVKTDVGLILLDLTMPGMDTLEFLAKLGAIKRHAKVPVVAMSATATKSPTAHLARISGFIAKPFNFELLLKVVDRKLGQKR